MTVLASPSAVSYWMRASHFLCHPLFFVSSSSRGETPTKDLLRNSARRNIRSVSVWAGTILIRFFADAQKDRAGVFQGDTPIVFLEEGVCPMKDL